MNLRQRQWPCEHVVLCLEPVDFRKSIDGLCALVEYSLERSVFDPTLYAFCNRSRDKARVLYWERNGFVLWYKRLEKARFIWPRTVAQAQQLTSLQLSWLLDGIDIERLQAHPSLALSSTFGG